MPITIPTNQDDVQTLLAEKGSLAFQAGRQKFLELKEYADNGNWTWKIAGCTAGCLIALDAMLSLLGNLVGLSPFKALLNLYLIVFGIFAAALEYKEKTFTQKYLDILRREALFLYRPYGRAAFYVLIGTLITFSGGILGYFIGAYTVMVGAIIFESSRNAAVALDAMHGAQFDEQDIKFKFQEFDVNKSGTLDKTEIAKLCEALGCRLTMNELESALFILDCDADGQVTYAEFLEWWKGKKYTNADQLE